MENRNKRLIWLVSCALMVALGVVFKALLTITVSPTMKLGFGVVPAMTAGIIFGPLSGFVVGALTDTVGFLIAPTGGDWSPFPLLMYGMSGVIPALFVSRFSLYRDRSDGTNALHYTRMLDFESVRTYWRLQLGVLAAQVICSMGINTLGFSLIYGKGFFVLLATRWPAALIMAFVYPLVILAVVRAWKMVFKGLPGTDWRLGSKTAKTT